MASLTPQSLVRLALPSPVPASFPLAHGCRADRSLPWQLAGRLLGGAQCEDQGAQALPLLLGGGRMHSLVLSECS